MRMLVAPAVALMAVSQASAVTVINGSFEDGPAIGPGGVTRLAAGDTSIPGWVVLPAGVDYFDASYLDPQDGDRAVELSSDAAGGIYQNLTGFTVGRSYELRFYLSANPLDPTPRPFTTRTIVSATSGDPALYSYTVTGTNAPDDMRYELNTYRFRAGSTGQRILFRSLSNTEYGPILDNVAIAEVPEPATWSLLILGFGLIGYAARRRVTTVSA